MHSKATPIKTTKKAEIVHLDSSHKREESSTMQTIKAKSPPTSGSKHVKLIQSFKHSQSQLQQAAKDKPKIATSQAKFKPVLTVKGAT